VTFNSTKTEGKWHFLSNDNTVISSRTTYYYATLKYLCQ